MIRSKGFLWFIFLCVCGNINAQIIEGLSSKWDDSVSEWIIFAFDSATETEIEGTLSMRWPLDNDWTIWDIRLQDYTATIKVKWRQDPNHWELRGQEIIQIKSVWKDDASNWNIIHDGKQSRFIAKSTFDGLEWQIKDDKDGYFGMIMEFQGDIRDWYIQDDTTEDISLDMKMAMMFIPLIRHISQ